MGSALAALALTTPAQAASPYCGITWGSVDRHGSPAGPGATVTDLRAGRHACYDRLVIDLQGTPAFNSWSVTYVDQVREDPSDRPVALRGGAFLLITLHSADGGSAYDPANPRELVNVTGYRTFRQVARTGAFEGVASLGLGVRAHLPFRVVTLPGIPGTSNGTRVAIDVAHAW